MVSSFSLMTELIPDAIVIPQFNLTENQCTYHSLITLTVEIDFLSMDIHYLITSENFISEKLTFLHPVSGGKKY